MFNKLASETGLLNIFSSLAAALGITKFTSKIFWSHFAVLLKSDLDVQQTGLRDWFVEHMLMLSSSFRCNEIYKRRFWSNFALLLKSDLDV